MLDCRICSDAFPSPTFLQSTIMEKRTFPCRFCEATFTSKTQLEKHSLWNHLDRPLPAIAPPVETKVQKAAGKGGGKKRYQLLTAVEKRDSSSHLDWDGRRWSDIRGLAFLTPLSTSPLCFALELPRVQLPPPSIPNRQRWRRKLSCSTRRMENVPL